MLLFQEQTGRANESRHVLLTRGRSVRGEIKAIGIGSNRLFVCNEICIKFMDKLNTMHSSVDNLYHVQVSQWQVLHPLDSLLCYISTA